jgi:23S rRNA (adenine2503-C2)-methyltransferase
MTTDELAEAVQQVGEPAYRARQMAEWVYGKSVTDPAVMTNVPRRLTETFDILTSGVIGRADSTDGTIKLLTELADGERVECVLIPSGKRATACLSTQAGCAMGCVFCASGMDGWRRNLSADEILEQVLHLQQAGDCRATNVVFMGTGEPLANYDAVLSAVRALIDPERFGISARHITISTVGLPKQMGQLAREDLPITLAVSLHAPNDALRRQLMPAAGKTTIAQIIEAAREYYESRKREVTVEYVLLAGVNDTNVCAEALAKVAGSLRCNVNLIHMNAVPGLPYRPSSKSVVRAFADRLVKHGVNVNVRRSRGGDIAAACGQLRRGDGQ